MEDKTNFYVLVMVAIVAIVGLIVMVAGNSGTKYASTTSDEAGQAVKRVAVTDSILRSIPICNETDGGINYFLFGIAKGMWPNSTSYETEYEICKDNDNLDEIYCGKDNYLHFVEYHCPYGCSGGACLPLTCNETDGGINYNTFGAAYGYWPESTTREKEVDVCNGTTSLVEMYCGDDKYLHYSLYKCPYGCSNGACLSQIIRKTCTDSDGTNINVAGFVYGWNGVANYTFYDSCEYAITSTAESIIETTTLQLREWTCSGDSPISTTAACPVNYRCSSGRCIVADDRNEYLT